MGCARPGSRSLEQKRGKKSSGELFCTGFQLFFLDILGQCSMVFNSFQFVLNGVQVLKWVLAL